MSKEYITRGKGLTIGVLTAEPSKRRSINSMISYGCEMVKMLI